MFGIHPYHRPLAHPSSQHKARSTGQTCPTLATRLLPAQLIMLNSPPCGPHTEPAPRQPCCQHTMNHPPSLTHCARWKWGTSYVSNHICQLRVSKTMVFFFFFFWPRCCGILVPQLGIEPRPSAVRVQSPNHWTAREFPKNHGF